MWQLAATRPDSVAGRPLSSITHVLSSIPPVSSADALDRRLHGDQLGRRFLWIVLRVFLRNFLHSSSLFFHQQKPQAAFAL